MYLMNYQVPAENERNIRLNLAVPIAAAIVMGPVTFWAVLAWAKKFWRTAGRVHYTMVALAGWVFLWWLNHYNLLGYHFFG